MSWRAASIIKVMFSSTTVRAVSITAGLVLLSFSVAGGSLSSVIEMPPAAASTTEPSSQSQIILDSFAEPDSLASTSTYYTVRADLRRCARPLCGGYLIKRVNQPVTRCADGRTKSECYAAEIDWTNQVQVDPRRALLRGELTSKIFAGVVGKLGVLRITESWQAASDKPITGLFFRARDLGVRCITHPCKTHHEAKLNSTVSRDIAGVDLTQTGATDELVGEANAAMTGQDGVLLAGSLFPVSGPAGRSETLRASRFYLRPEKQQSSNDTCRKTGCSGQICADRDVLTTCEYRTEYACYQTAKCERQSSGKCGFTQTPELTACLKGK